MIAQDLNRILPPEYVAIPQTTPWTPGEPAWSGPLEWSQRDLFEIRVLSTGDSPQLVGAIELVSPANKDRPAAWQAFAGKCAGYLRNQIGVIVVDVVTNRHHDLHRELLELLELDAPLQTWGPAKPPLYAIAYRTLMTEQTRLELWPQQLTIGNTLPTLPFWLAADYAVPVNLEASYGAACEMLRIV